MDGFRRGILSRKVVIRLLVITLGLGVILLSLFAFQLGLDNDPGWGTRRFQILGAGIGLVLFGCLYWITPVLSRSFEAFFPQKEEPLQNESTQIYRWRQNKWTGWISKNQIAIGLVFVTCCAIWVYLWVITIGRMDKWPAGRDYYGLLTQAFQEGHTYLPVEPSAELLKLQNPYDLQQRKGLDYLWDTTLYQGKYYLYWGPVPAVLGLFVSVLTSKSITDAGFVFIFVVGTLIISVLLLKKIYEDYKFSSWVFWGGLVSLSINIPLIWLLTHPAYYEVSISGGQFFMMMGFFFLYDAFRSSSVRKGYLMLSALSFGLAGGTRINLLPSVIFLSVLIVWRIYVFYDRRFSVSIPAFAAVAIPLVTVACLLAWYNYARFGSIFEFGHRYQLSGLSLTPDYKDQISIKYIVPNLYTYLFRLPSLNGKFPFVTVPWIKENMWPSFIRLPENYYYPEPVAGVLFVIPLIGFAAVLLIRLVWLLINGDVSWAEQDKSAPNALSWFAFALLGTVAIQMFVLFMFVSASMRYLFDLAPALILVSTIFVGYTIPLFEEKPYFLKTIFYLWFLTAVLTVIAGFLIGFTGGQNNFLNKNPQLYHQLAGWFGR